jgi:pimeloyl-ACP methyl ester carboxylesterase
MASLNRRDDEETMAKDVRPATQPQDELSFMYFPDSYRWSHGLLIGLNAAPWGGAEIGEVNRIGLRLKAHVGDDRAWFREWSREAEKVEASGRTRLAAGYGASAAAYLLRAANYYHVGERFLQPKSEGLDAYRRGVECFRDAAKLLKHPRIEHVEVPYEGASLPALLVHAETTARPDRVPAMVFFDGFDITKEIQYFKGVPDLAQRGIACLIVDGPGNGESPRFRKLYLHHETERYGAAAYEYLASRPEIDPQRIGVMAISLGGYYAPRAAAFEHRFACCIAWGAQWDYWATWKKRFDLLDSGKLPSLSVPWEHLLWIFNVNTRDEAMKMLEGFRLDGIVQKIRCPFLLLHGEGDEQLPLAVAQTCIEQVGSRDKTLKVFTREEGGYHHCQIDNVSIGISFMWDWLEDRLLKRCRHNVFPPPARQAVPGSAERYPRRRAHARSARDRRSRHRSRLRGRGLRRAPDGVQVRSHHFCNGPDRLLPRAGQRERHRDDGCEAVVAARDAAPA